jgi:tRNA1(Val) A37 N6-methylase TrmN6
MAKSKKKITDVAVEAPRPLTKLGALIALLRTEAGADIVALTKATGWQPHSVRGAIAGQIKKKLGLMVTTERVDGRIVYRIA